MRGVELAFAFPDSNAVTTASLEKTGPKFSDD